MAPKIAASRSTVSIASRGENCEAARRSSATITDWSSARSSDSSPRSTGLARAELSEVQGPFPVARGRGGVPGRPQCGSLHQKLADQLGQLAHDTRRGQAFDLVE